MPTLVDVQKELENLRKYLETEDPDLGVAKYRLEMLRRKTSDVKVPEGSAEYRGVLALTILFDQDEVRVSSVASLGKSDGKFRFIPRKKVG